MNPRYNFLSVRTFGYALACGGIVGSLLGRNVVVGLIVFAVVYVLAALGTENVTTCRFCGTRVNPQATRCFGCGESLRSE